MESNLPAATPKKNDTGIQSYLNRADIRTRFESMLHSRAPAFMSSIVSAVAMNSELKRCDPVSVVSAAAVAAALDLPINPSLGFAHIVPYRGVAQFQIGWKGFVQLAMRSGQYKTINITPVLEGEIASINKFTGEMKFSGRASSDKQVGYLLYFSLINGFEKYFYMTREECEAHAKRYSASYKRGEGLWARDFEAMALKTVAKLGLTKYGILSVSMEKALVDDQAAISTGGKREYVDNQGEIHEEPVRALKPVADLNKELTTKKNSDQRSAKAPEKVANDSPRETILTGNSGTVSYEKTAREDGDAESGDIDGSRPF